uniref:Uncharacterized protein n=1 Tax=Ciona intestinalis TaxID=7719 RepID=H2XSW6_CIOIN
MLNTFLNYSLSVASTPNRKQLGYFLSAPLVKRNIRYIVIATIASNAMIVKLKLVRTRNITKKITFYKDIRQEVGEVAEKQFY